MLITFISNIIKIILKKKNLNKQKDFIMIFTIVGMVLIFIYNPIEMELLEYLRRRHIIGIKTGIQLQIGAIQQ